MEFFVRQGDRQEKVTVSRDGAHFDVRLGEIDHRVGSVRAGDAISMIVGGRQREAIVSLEERRQGRSRYRVTTADGSEQVEVLDPLAYLASNSRVGGSRKGKREVCASIPGRVVSLLAEEGQTVAARDGILVIEAMKMENEITAESDGTVAAIFVEPGQTVEPGDPLFEVVSER